MSRAFWYSDKKSPCYTNSNYSDSYIIHTEIFSGCTGVQFLFKILVLNIYKPVAFGIQHTMPHRSFVHTTHFINNL